MTADWKEHHANEAEKAHRFRLRRYDVDWRDEVFERHEDGDWISVEDLDVIRHQERERMEPHVKAAVSAMASIAAATGRARLLQKNPDLDGFTIDEELDEISAQVNVLRESLAALDTLGDDQPEEQTDE